MRPAAFVRLHRGQSWDGIVAFEVAGVRAAQHRCSRVTNTAMQIAFDRIVDQRPARTTMRPSRGGGAVSDRLFAGITRKQCAVFRALNPPTVNW